VKLSPEDLKKAMSYKTGGELYIIAHARSHEYTSEAAEAARAEIERRQLDVPTLGRLFAVAELAAAEKSRKSDIGENASTKIRSSAGNGASGCALGLFLILGIIGAIIYGGYEGLDSLGLIPHAEEAVISARGDWLVGESKECVSATLNSESAAIARKDQGYALASLPCDGGPEHKMNVTFYGREVQPEYKTISWKCTRNEASFTCYQTGGQQ
jgi:hypothetical protein